MGDITAALNAATAGREACPRLDYALFRPVRRPIATVALLLAWLCANGAIWDVAQVIAWSRMFAANTASMDVGEAFRATFDPANRCRLCAKIAEGRVNEEQQMPAPNGPADEKLVLAREVPARMVLVSPAVNWPPAPARVAPVRIEPVQVRPPRVG